MDKLYAVLGYKVKNQKLMENALTHSSFANEKRNLGASSNERLEFLGDSVLGMVTAEHLYQVYPDKPEGELTKIRASLVCEQSLVRVARRLELGKYLRLGHGEEMGGGRERTSILADATEAVIAAVYLDGGFEAAKNLIHRLILDVKNEEDIQDYKTVLQEIIQRTGGNTIGYELTGSKGPDHNKVFFVSVSINGKVAGTGSGRSKKEAEQMAAKAAISGIEK